ncbi:hypothetical protein [Gimesia maris]|uniref:hypothetical protein n=1 Tax=Gimesia maris TaxID=122 RepID=UPI000E96D982|nr:hypothetical protein [Gimesia maris]HAW31314.1 hypothetical protein [Planctomycetaceae bacterium]|tara:strand:- start:1566 stop:1859 length:294 start_codon:yes stop_codon:yes gene_type:complete
MESNQSQIPDQPDQKQQQPAQKPWSWRRYIITSTIQVTVFLLLYVLSIGPLFWQWYASFNSMSSPFFAAFYTPLLLACDLIPPLSDGVNWYINLWIG